MNTLSNTVNMKAQIWIETVIYTLIILVIIGILLSVLKPAIQDKQDQVVLEKSLGMLQEIDNSIQNVRVYGPGNSIPLDLQIKQGQLIINGEEDYILFTMQSNNMYSELDQTIANGKINITTVSKGKVYEVRFKLNYKNLVNISWNKKDSEKTINFAPGTQRIFIMNYGRNINNIGELINIDLNS